MELIDSSEFQRSYRPVDDSLEGLLNEGRVWVFQRRDGVNYTRRKQFLRSYPLHWEKEMEGDTGNKSLRRMKAMVLTVVDWRCTLLLWKKLKQKLTASAHFVGSCHGNLESHMPYFEVVQK
eukprot:Gb_15922 [translate_table: standard]